MDESLKLLRLPLAQQPEQAWANGGGRTRQVAIEPADATFAGGFAWRVSIAQVASDGPFSMLPGLDRSLWLLRGDGMVLTLGDRAVRVERPYQRCDFAGETAVASRLLGGPCEDLNVMTDRRRVRAHCELQQLAAGSQFVVDRAPQRLVVVLHGQAKADGVVLDPGDALRAVGEAAFTVRCPLACALLVCRFLPV
jgi:uncharacterized protein